MHFPTAPALTQTGVCRAICSGVATGVSLVAPAPVIVLAWKRTPLPGEAKTMANREPALRLSRIMTPPLAQGSLLPMLSTLAMMEPLPLSDL